MPIYAYRCKQCGEEFEKLFLSAARTEEVSCPQCESDEVEQRPTLFGVGGGGRTMADSDCAPTGSG